MVFPTFCLLDSDMDDGDNYIVACILDKKHEIDGIYYLVKWENYGFEHSEWVHTDRMSCVTVVAEFEFGRSELLQNELRMCKDEVKELRVLNAAANGVIVELLQSARESNNMNFMEFPNLEPALELADHVEHVEEDNVNINDNGDARSIGSSVDFHCLDGGK